MTEVVNLMLFVRRLIFVLQYHSNMKGPNRTLDSIVDFGIPNEMLLLRS